MKKTTLWGLSLLIAILAACNKQPSDPALQPIHLSQKSLEILQTSNDFSFELFRDIHTHDSSPDLLISPLSISLALGMTYNGAEGTTLQAFEKVLHLHNLNTTDLNKAFQELQEKLLHADPGVTMEIANSIWYRKNYPVAPSFIDVNKKY